jgi:hypothetical protein
MYLYFSYGVEMVPHFMHSICPKAVMYCVGVCEHYRFHINVNGVANIQPSFYAKVYGVVWKVDQNDHDSLTTWAKEYFSPMVKEKQTIFSLPSAQNENVHASKKANQLYFEVFFFRSLSCQYDQASSQYINSLVKQLQHLGVSQDYISELRLWTSIL